MAKKTNQKTAKNTEESPKEVAEETTKEVEEPAKESEVKPEESVKDSAPKFKNNGKAIKINLGTRDESNWITVKADQIVTIPEKIALANGLEKVE